MTSAFRAKPVMSHPSKDGSIDGNAMFFFFCLSLTACRMLVP